MIDLTEYFDKYGFGDGEMAAVGRRWMPIAIGCLRRAFVKVGMKVEVRELDVVTLHNSCRLEIRRGSAVLLAHDGMGRMGECGFAAPELIQRAFQRARRAFRRRQGR